MFYSNSKKIAEFNQGFTMSNGLHVSNLANHWTWKAMRFNNYLEGLFTQEKSIGTLTVNNGLFTSGNEYAIEGDIVAPRTSSNIYCFFQAAILGNAQGLIGLGEVIVQGAPTSISGIFLSKDGTGAISFMTAELNTILQSETIDNWNGDQDAVNYVKNNFINNSISYCIKWDTHNKQASLFLVKDNTLWLLHSHKPYLAFSGSLYVLQKQYSFTAYSAGGTFRIDGASMLVSPYTYTFINTFTLMPSPVNILATGALQYVAIAVGLRSVDRQCVDLLSYSVRQVTARNASVNVVEYKQHSPAVFGIMGFGILNFNMYSASFQGGVPTITPLSQDRVRHSSQLPNNNVDIYTHNEIIKNVARTSACANAETVSFKRTFCAITLQNSVAAGGQAFVNATFGEY